jgi:cytochrome b involved in lipid metabolism
MKYIYPVALAAALVIVAGAWYFSSGSSYSSASTTISTATATTTSATYTLAQVAMHNSASDCWTTINGSVYNITPFIPDHPGGDRILVVCGVDGTSAFEAQHSDNRQANAELATLKIGILVAATTSTP